ncbi:hypothetical protein PCANC_02308 [Puccinia coronata f. sp. avenae]|uniref:Uncharacterized protein n=1 Tax=Puccinia coronata f. sp. avenae TaxID=200324 RepID=A0A2N5VZD1_9BASI|nr:hypothetical protein PCANC_02308 [Puccinia coronata f. sp. avenae]
MDHRSSLSIESNKDRTNFANLIRQFLEHSGHSIPCSPLSSNQPHAAQTVLDLLTIWISDGSQRQILVADGCLQVAKKILFPSFKDSAKFSQDVNIPHIPPATTENLPSKPVNMSAKQPTYIPSRSLSLLCSDQLEEDSRKRNFVSRADCQSSSNSLPQLAFLESVDVAYLLNLFPILRPLHAASNPLSTTGSEGKYASPLSPRSFVGPEDTGTSPCGCVQETHASRRPTCQGWEDAIQQHSADDSQDPATAAP